jgi:hypothetical protein
MHLQYSLSDGVLAWRCYVIFGKRHWLKWTLTVVVLLLTGMCCMYLWYRANFCAIVCGLFSGIIGLLWNWAVVDRQQETTVAERLDLLQYPTTLTWAACSLLLNTVLSTSIIVKIV